MCGIAGVYDLSGRTVLGIESELAAKDGGVIDLWPRDPLGHVNKPMTDEDVGKKFHQTVEPVFGQTKTAQVLERWWRVKDASAAEVPELLKLLDVTS